MTIDDQNLWRRAQDGDADAFGTLFERHAPSVHAFCLRRCADPHVADDLTSIVFLEAWRRRDVALTGDSARPWLLGVAVNVLHSQWRSRRRHAAALARLYHEPSEPDGAERVAERVDASRRLAEARDALRGLRQEDLDVLTLIAWGDLDYAGAAIALDVPVGTVRSRLSRARSRLQAHPALAAATAASVAEETP